MCLCVEQRVDAEGVPDAGELFEVSAAVSLALEGVPEIGGDRSNLRAR